MKNFMITDTRFYTFPQTGETVKLEESNTETGYARRLSVGEWSTDWCTNYSKILGLASRVDSHVRYYHTLESVAGDLPHDVVFLVFVL